MAQMFDTKSSVLEQMEKVSGSTLAFNIVNEDHKASDGHLIFAKEVETHNFRVTFVSLNRGDVIKAAAKIEADEPATVGRMPKFAMREVHYDPDLEDGGKPNVVFVQSGI